MKPSVRLFWGTCALSGLVHVAQAEELSLDELVLLDLNALSQIQVEAASRLPQTVDSAPATVRVITDEEIRRRGYRSLEDALATLPGMQFRNIQGFNTYTFMRGVPNQNDKMLVLVDGVQVNELNSGGFYGGSQFNLDNVKRIEVIYGPSSALYGTNAFSGVVNLVTYAPGDTGRTEAKVTLGSFDTRDVALRHDRYDPTSHFGYSLAAMVNTTEKTELGGAAGDYQWNEGMENFEDNLSLEGKLRYGELDMGLLFQDKHASRTTNYDNTYVDNGTDWHISFLNLWLKHQHQLAEQLQLKSQLYYRDATVEDDTIGYINTADGQTAYYRPNHLWGADVQLLYTPSPRTSMVLGVDWERESLADGFSKTYSGDVLLAPPAPDEPERLVNRRTSLYGELRQQLTRPLTLSLGLRYDDSSSYDQVTTPKLGLVYAEGDLTAKLLYGEAFRAPKPWDYTWGTGNSDLIPEAMESLEGVVAYRFAPGLKADLSLYRNVITDFITNGATNRVNEGELTTHGAELGLNYQRGPVMTRINYTYTDSEDLSGQHVDEIAPHMAYASIDYRHSHELDMGLNVSYQGERTNKSDVTHTNDSAWVLGGNIRWRSRDGWELSLIGDNLLDEEYYHSNRSSNPTRYRQAERNWHLTARYGFK